MTNALSSTAPHTWTKKVELPLSHDNLGNLFDNLVPAVRISEFATQEECETLMECLDVLPRQKYPGVVPEIEKAGPTQFEAGTTAQSEYFSLAKSYSAMLENVFDKSFSPIERMRKVLVEASGKTVEIATEPDGQRYFAGVVRIMKEGTPLHIDFARYDAPNWCIKDVEAQLAWNLYIATGRNGGQCEIFNRQWDHCDDPYKEEYVYGFKDDLILGKEKHVMEPKTGDVLMFNCRNYHRVIPSSDLRVTIGSFVGKMGDKLLLWS